MDNQGERSKEAIQLKFEDLNQQDIKIVSISTKEMDYAKLSEKIEASFQLYQSALYRLYYIDEDKQQISVNTEDDYRIFLQKANQSSLHIVSTVDKDIDFRKFLQKRVQKSPVIAKKELQSIIQNQRKLMMKELQEFNIKMQERTKKQMVSEITKIEKQVREKLQQQLRAQKDSRIGQFKTQIGCQSRIYCQQKSAITGYRYKCIFCCIYMCEQCYEREFETSMSSHNKFHPILQLKSDNWDDLIIAVMKNQYQSNQINDFQCQKPKQEKKQAIEELQQIQKKPEEQSKSLVLQNLDPLCQQPANKALES